MHLNFIAYLVVGILAASSLATPLNHTTRFSQDAQAKRWKPDPNGNLYVTNSDTKKNWGSQNPHKAIAPIGKHCHDGQCSNFAADTKIYKDGNYPTDFKIKFNFEGTHEEWVRNGLFDVMFEMLKKATEKRKKKWIFHPDCNPGEGDCSFEHQHLWEHWTFERLTIKYHNPHNKIQSDFAFDVNIDEAENDSGLCEDVLGAASAIAGAVNGIAGGIFSLAQLGC